MEQGITIISSERFQELASNLESLKLSVQALVENINSKKIYSEEELCKLLHLSPKTLQTYRNEGRIGFVKPKEGRRILYTEQHLKEFLMANETRAIKAKIKNF
jgi:hypothetical protein